MPGLTVLPSDSPPWVLVWASPSLLLHLCFACRTVAAYAVLLSAMGPHTLNKEQHVAQQAPADMQDRACGSRSKPMTATATTMVKAVWQSYFNNPEGQSAPLEELPLTANNDSHCCCPWAFAHARNAALDSICACQALLRC